MCGLACERNIFFSFFFVRFFHLFLLLSLLAFLMSCSTLPSTLQFDRTVNKQGFMLLPLPMVRFSLLFFLCEDKQLGTSSIAAAATAAGRHQHIYDFERLSLLLRSHCCIAGKGPSGSCLLTASLPFTFLHINNVIIVFISSSPSRGEGTADLGPTAVYRFVQIAFFLRTFFHFVDIPQWNWQCCRIKKCPVMASHV